MLNKYFYQSLILIILITLVLLFLCIFMLLKINNSIGKLIVNSKKVITILPI